MIIKIIFFLKSLKTTSTIFLIVWINKIIISIIINNLFTMKNCWTDTRAWSWSYG